MITTGKIKKGLIKLISIREMGVAIPLVIAVLFFSSQNATFFSSDNIINILRVSSFTFITAIGMTFLLTAGGLDLSVGAVFAFSGMVCAMLLTAGIAIPIAIILALLCGGLVGTLNGALVQIVRLPPMIATIATMYIVRGLVLGIRRGEPIFPLPEAFGKIGNTNVFSIGTLSVPYIVMIALVLGIIAAFILKYTSFGRMIFAVGGNDETSRLAGISVRQIRFSAYVMTAMLAATTGILSSSRMGSAQPNVGVGFEMQVIAACVIGGVSVNGGAGSILGTLFGSIFMAMITNGMTMIRISAYWQQLIMGIILVLACSLDQIRQRVRK